MKVRLSPSPSQPHRAHSPRAQSHRAGTARRLGVSAAAALAAVLIAGCEPTAESAESATSAATTTDRGDITWSSTPTTTTETDDDSSDIKKVATKALGELDELSVKGRAPKTGYDRSLFGQAWTDDVSVDGGHNGCDTRNDILGRDLTDITFKPGTRDCVVLSGTLNDPYTKSTIDFVRGSSTSSKVQIDHVVALADAWQKGAQQLSTQERTDFANDPRNLLAVDGPTNQQKSAGDAATWLPPNRSYRCTYVARQIEVKRAYRLWVTAAEKSAMERVLTGCGGTQRAADDTSSKTSTPERTRTTEPTRTPAPETTAPETTDRPVPRAPLVETTPEAPAGGDAYYKNCAAARAAGAAPLRVGEPGYRSKLDGDGDGVACE